MDHPGNQKLSQAEILEQPQRVLPSVSLPPSVTAASPLQSNHEDQLKLRLHMETQDLKIKRLQRELQLAHLKLASNTEKSPKPNDSVKTGDKSSKRSLGDQRAPQRITNQQEWLHIFTPLSMAEFPASYTVIIKCCTDVSRRAALISHFHNLMVLASTYIWSVVRAFHYKVLRSIEMGLVSWWNSFDSLKHPFFLPTVLLADSTNKTRLRFPRLPLLFPAVKSVMLKLIDECQPLCKKDSANIL